jgi:hypothetical protein
VKVAKGMSTIAEKNLTAYDLPRLAPPRVRNATVAVKISSTRGVRKYRIISLEICE